jgi:hypothetical protein
MCRWLGLRSCSLGISVIHNLIVRRMGLERSGPPRQPFAGVIWRWPDGSFLNSGQASNSNPYAHFAIDTMTNLGLWSPHYAYLAQAQGWEYTNVSCAAGPGHVVFEQLPVEQHCPAAVDRSLRTKCALWRRSALKSSRTL